MVGLNSPSVIDWILENGIHVVPYNLYVRLLNRRRRQDETAQFERDFGHLQRLTAPNATVKSRHQGARTLKKLG